jgi:hypothetical protein
LDAKFGSNLSEQKICAYLDNLAHEQGEVAPLSRLRLKELYWTVSRELGRVSHALFPFEMREENVRAAEPVWRPAEEPSLARAPTLKRPRLLLDMTSTLRTGKSTGIQRVVREIARQGWMMGEGLPVAIHAGELRPFYRSPHFHGAVEIEEGDILLMMDATWNHLHEYLPIIERVKAKGGSTLERVHRFPIRGRIHGSIEACESSIESAMEARDGAGLQPGFA